jgi:uncharacterized membrane protein
MIQLKTGSTRRVESDLAHLLNYGTWLGSLLIAAGLVWPNWRLEFLRWSLPLVTLGVVVLIALPVIRVLVMWCNFMITHERRFAMLALTVLVIIGIGLAVGISEG